VAKVFEVYRAAGLTAPYGGNIAPRAGGLGQANALIYWKRITPMHGAN